MPLGVAVAAVVDAAAGHDPDVRAFAHEEVVVDHVVAAALRHHHGDIDVLSLGAGGDADVDAVFVGFRFNGDVLAVLAEGLLAVGTDVHGALFGDGGHVGHFLQNALLDFVQHLWSTSSLLQPVMVSAMIWE